jgi:hypothetical protein
MYLLLTPHFHAICKNNRHFVDIDITKNKSRNGKNISRNQFPTKKSDFHGLKLFDTHNECSNVKMKELHDVMIYLNIDPHGTLYSIEKKENSELTLFGLHEVDLELYSTASNCSMVETTL